jgi:hypothetical protein
MLPMQGKLTVYFLKQPVEETRDKGCKCDRICGIAQQPQNVQAVAFRFLVRKRGKPQVAASVFSLQ